MHRSAELITPQSSKSGKTGGRTGQTTHNLKLEVWATNMGFQALGGILGTFKGTYRVHSRYVGILGLRARARGTWFQL